MKKFINISIILGCILLCTYFFIFAQEKPEAPKIFPVETLALAMDADSGIVDIDSIIDDIKTPEIYVPKRKPNWLRWEKYHIKYDTLLTKYSDSNNIDRNLVEAIISWESNWTAGGTSPSNCRGLMQVMGGSHNPEKNIRSGCGIFNRYRAKMDSWFKNKYNIELSPEDLHKAALTAYNRGCGGAHKYYRKHKHLKVAGKDYEIKHSKYALSVWWIYLQIQIKKGFQ